MPGWGLEDVKTQIQWAIDDAMKVMDQGIDGKGIDYKQLDYLSEKLSILAAFAEVLEKRLVSPLSFEQSEKAPIIADDNAQDVLTTVLDPSPYF